MNRAESERLASHLEAMGYQATDNADEADFIVVNSCMVRRSAESRVVNKLDVLKLLKKARPATVLAVTGCLVNGDPGKLKKRFPHVDHFFKPGEVPPFLGSTAVLPERPAVTVFVPIIQGCNNFCSYCIVPYRRGRERSRPLAEVICEVQELVRRGAREVTLLGQNVDSYGNDLPERPSLAGLLTELNSIEGLARIRFLTNHPKDMSQGLMQAMSRLDKVCEYVSLPVQSGSDEILEAMRRGYTAADYRRLVADIRRQVPGVALSTDVIVGYPSETAAQFQETVDLLFEIKFDTVHVAVYSPRPGTLAFRETVDDVPKSEKQARLAVIEELQTKVAGEINSVLLGQTVEVLVEKKAGNKWQSRTRTDKLVFFEDSASYPGQLVQVKISKASPWSLQGTLAGKEVTVTTC